LKASNVAERFKRSAQLRITINNQLLLIAPPLW